MVWWWDAVALVLCCRRLSGSVSLCCSGEGEGECEGEGEAVLAQVAVRESFVVFRNLSTAAPYT